MRRLCRPACDEVIYGLQPRPDRRHRGAPGHLPPTFEALVEAERLLQNTPAPIHEGGDRTCYIPSADEIHMPPRAAFVSPESFYSVALHETHATGHKSRLDRNLSGRFSTDAYAMEKLVAELGAAFLCAKVGILLITREDHAHYLASWVRVLRSDKKAVFTAAAGRAGRRLTSRDARSHRRGRPRKGAGRRDASATTSFIASLTYHLPGSVLIFCWQLAWPSRAFQP